MDTTVKIKWTFLSRPSITTREDVAALLRPFGAVESSEIVLSLKPPLPKKPKRGTALIPFKQIGDAFAAVCSTGSVACGLKDIDVSWAEGKEPDLIGWLKKMGKLGGEARVTFPTPTPHLAEPSALDTLHVRNSEAPGVQASSTFPSTFVSVISYMWRRHLTIVCSPTSTCLVALRPVLELLESTTSP